jgi:hypothetical protein
MTALERLAALRAIMGERAEIDSLRPLAPQHFRLNITQQLRQGSPAQGSWWEVFDRVV